MGGWQPVLRPARARAQQLGLAISSNDDGVDGLRAALRIDRGHQVLEAEIDRKRLLAAGLIERVIELHLPRSDGQFPGCPIYREWDQLPLENPVEVPLVVRDVLEIPD